MVVASNRGSLVRDGLALGTLLHGRVPDLGPTV